ncbi:MAG: putative iron-sulfur cluster-binding metallochaperone [Deltaproteobacteria bacterium]
MSDCCSVPPSQAKPKAVRRDARTPCPRCGAVGTEVADETMVALLKPGLAAPLLALDRRFCRTPSCEILYYGADGRFVEKGAATVRVGLKETLDPVQLCYCFDFTRADVRQELAETGTTTIPARITAEVRAGRCACEVKNPSGRCCLGEVNKAVKEARDAIGRARAEPPSESTPDGGAGRE